MIKQLVDSELEIAFIGLIIVGILEICAIIKGVDGVMFGAAMATIGAVTGWVFKTYNSRTKKP